MKLRQLLKYLQWLLQARAEFEKVNDNNYEPAVVFWRIKFSREEMRVLEEILKIQIQ